MYDPRGNPLIVEGKSKEYKSHKGRPIVAWITFLRPGIANLLRTRVPRMSATPLASRAT